MAPDNDGEHASDLQGDAPAQDKTARDKRPAQGAKPDADPTQPRRTGDAAPRQ